MDAMLKVVFQDAKFRWKKEGKSILLWCIAEIFILLMWYMNWADIRFVLDKEKSLTIVWVTVFILEKILFLFFFWFVFACPYVFQNQLSKTMDYLPLTEKDKSGYIAVSKKVKFIMINVLNMAVQVLRLGIYGGQNYWKNAVLITVVTFFWSHMYSGANGEIKVDPLWEKLHSVKVAADQTLGLIIYLFLYIGVSVPLEKWTIVEFVICPMLISVLLICAVSVHARRKNCAN